MVIDSIAKWKINTTKLLYKHKMYTGILYWLRNMPSLVSLSSYNISCHGWCIGCVFSSHTIYSFISNNFIHDATHYPHYHNISRKNCKTLGIVITQNERWHFPLGGWLHAHMAFMYRFDDKATFSWAITNHVSVPVDILKLRPEPFLSDTAYLQHEPHLCVLTTSLSDSGLSVAWSDVYAHCMHTRLLHVYANKNLLCVE